jgi:hypothetical protein
MSEGGDLAQPQEDKSQTASTDAQGRAIDASALGGEVARARNTMHPNDEAAYEAATSARAPAGGGPAGESGAGDFTLPDDAADTAAMPALDFAGGLPDSRTRFVNANRMAQHAQTHQFKKIAIPLLLAVGALLLVMCIAMGVLLLTDNMGQGDKTLHVAFVVAALLVSLILLAGAWWFHKEIRDDQRRQEQLAQFQQQQQGMGQPPQQQ